MDRPAQYRITLETVLNEHAQLSQQVRAEHLHEPERLSMNIFILSGVEWSGIEELIEELIEQGIP